MDRKAISQKPDKCNNTNSVTLDDLFHALGEQRIVGDQRFCSLVPQLGSISAAPAYPEQRAGHRAYPTIKAPRLETGKRQPLQSRGTQLDSSTNEENVHKIVFLVKLKQTSYKSSTLRLSKGVKT